MSRDLSATWSLPTEELLRMLDVAEEGLDEKEAQKRLRQYGANLLKPRKKSYSILLLLAQFNSPIILLLIFAVGLSFYLHQVTGASIILLIVFISGLLSFWQERRAADAVAGLQAMIQIKASIVTTTALAVPLTTFVPIKRQLMRLLRGVSCCRIPVIFSAGR